MTTIECGHIEHLTAEVRQDGRLERRWRVGYWIERFQWMSEPCPPLDDQEGE